MSPELTVYITLLAIASLHGRSAPLFVAERDCRFIC